MPRVVITALALIFACATPASAEAPEQILSFDVALDVARDGSVHVTERIALRAGPETFRKGLVRVIETSRWRDHGVGWIQLPFRFRDARHDGESTSHRETATGGAFARSGVRVRVGPSPRGSPGIQRYELRWETHRRTSYGPLADELVWEVTGFGWPVAIRAASVEVRVEGLTAPLELRAAIGPRGAAGRPVEAVWDPERGATARTDAPIAPGEGLTFRMVLPKWSIQAPSYHRETEWFWLDWWGWIETGWSLVAVSGVYLLMWLRVGVDRRERPVVVRYEPVGDLSPAALGFLHRRGYHPRHYAAAVVGLAIKGMLRIRRTGERWRLERGQGRAPLTFDERAVLAALLGDAREVALEPGSAQALARGEVALRSALAAGLERAFFVANRRWWLAGLVVSAAALGVLSWRWRFQVEAGASVVLVILAFVSFLTASLLARALGFLRHGHAGGGATALARGALLSFATAPAAVSVLTISRALLAMVPGHLIVAGVAIGITNAVFYHLLERPTRAGRPILARVEGFRRFLDAVDADRLARTGGDALTPEAFERHFPYAIALGVEKRWASRFGALLTPPAFGSASEEYRHDWYAFDGASGGRRNAVADLGPKLAEALSPPAAR